MQNICTFTKQLGQLVLAFDTFFNVDFNPFILIARIDVFQIARQLGQGGMYSGFLAHRIDCLCESNSNLGRS